MIKCIVFDLDGTLFLNHGADIYDLSDEAIEAIRLMKENGESIIKIVGIKSDHYREFENEVFFEFCNEHGIHHEFSAPKTPQKNGVFEHKNWTL